MKGGLTIDEEYEEILNEIFTSLEIEIKYISFLKYEVLIKNLNLKFEKTLYLNSTFEMNVLDFKKSIENAVKDKLRQL